MGLAAIGTGLPSFFGALANVGVTGFITVAVPEDKLGRAGVGLQLLSGAGLLAGAMAGGLAAQQIGIRISGASTPRSRPCDARPIFAFWTLPIATLPKACINGLTQAAVPTVSAHTPVALQRQPRSIASPIIPRVSSIEQWWRDGAQLELALNGSERHVFVRRWRNAAPHMTLLHGFPSSSHDWAKVAPALAERFELLALDFLGFGASDKPPDYAYSLGEQADLVEAVWETEGVTATTVLAHDYAVSVTQELLARRAEGTLSTEIVRVHFLNGGLYPDVHRPQPIQTALLDPEQGPQISANLSEELFVAGLAPTFAPGYDSTADAVALWHSLRRDGGDKNLHLLIRYMTDRKRNEARWVGALERTDVPVAFVWGMLDPVSGAHMAARIRERLPQAPFTALEDVGHWPPLEAPARVAIAILNA